jgi:hypothetical protein
MEARPNKQQPPVPAEDETTNANPAPEVRVSDEEVSEAAKRAIEKNADLLNRLGR